ncbi:MAG: ADP-ribosylglycohydrolase family protein [Alphaproteobacteria bacterium]
MAGGDAFDRALGALVGGALGDALGMPTQVLSPAQIRSLYGRVETFVEPPPWHPVSKGLAAGAVTDDTEQALLLGRLLLDRADGWFDHAAWAAALVDWEGDARKRGCQDLLGPSTRRAIEAFRAGVPAAEAGRYGDTNGAAMRIAPVGLLMPPEPLDALVDAVAETCLATHNTSIAIAAASAVAMAVSVGIEGGTWRQAMDRATQAAGLGAKRGHWIAGADIAARIAWARDLVRDREASDAMALVIDLIGTSVASQESVPAAFAVLEIADGDPWEAAVISANLGGDTDTIGAIAAGMAGAAAGFSALPADKVAALRGVDLDSIRSLAAELLERRAVQLADAGDGP